MDRPDTRAPVAASASGSANGPLQGTLSVAGVARPVHLPGTASGF